MVVTGSAAFAGTPLGRSSYTTPTYNPFYSPVTQFTDDNARVSDHEWIQHMFPDNGRTQFPGHALRLIQHAGSPSQISRDIQWHLMLGPASGIGSENGNVASDAEGLRASDLAMYQPL